MAIIASVKILSSFDVPVAQATAFTVPTSVLRMRTDQASVTNYSGSPETLTVYFLQSGEAVANIFKRLDAFPVPANTTLSLFELTGMVLETGGIINAFASSASALSLTVNGTNFT